MSIKNIKSDKGNNKLQDAKVKFIAAESQLKFNENLINKNVSSLWKQSVDKLQVKIIAESLEDLNKKEDLVELKNVLIAKFVLDESVSDEKPEILHKIVEKWINRAVVVIFSSCDQENIFSIYWKTKELHNFLTFKVYNDEPLKFDKDLRRFIIEFLIISLDNGHSGLHRSCTLSYGQNQVELHFLADSRDYNLLFIASEQGYASVVNSLLELGISSEIPGVDVNPQILAWNNRHFDALLALLQANLTYPPSFNIEDCSKELKDFVEIADHLHASIIHQDEENIKEIIQLYPNLRYFYNSSNESAPKIALIHNFIDIYVILITNKIFLGSHENTEEILKDLNYEDRRLIREIHFKELQDLPEKHINILVAHSFVGHDSHDVKKKLNLVINAFRVLNNIPGIREILIITAASKKFCIIFDFNRDSVQLMDPTVSSGTAGLFYLSGRIYIGAKQLLDSKTETYAFATLAHELCHYAMYLTYYNDANPYKKNDKKTMKEVEQVLILCEVQKEKEDVILMVYTLYPDEQHHAELIVRIPHLLALYNDQPEKIKALRVIYDKLFNLYENKIVPEMIKSVPEIETKIEKEIEKKDKKISKLRRFFICFIVFGAILTGLLGLLAYYLYTPNYKFSALSKSNQILVKNSLINYKNVTVKFSDIFIDEYAYENLTSTYIEQMLKGQTIDFSNPHLLYLNPFIKFKWESLAPKLKEKLFRSNVTFQNQNLNFSQLYQEDLELFNYLNSTQIKQVLDGDGLSVGKFIENTTTFNVERNFIFEDMAIFYSNFSSKNTGISFKSFMDEFLNRSIDSISQDVEAYKITSSVIDPVDYNNTDVQAYYKNSDVVISETENSKFFILSSEAGSGKSFTFKQLALKIKKKYPTRWVSYLNLRKQATIYQKIRSKIKSLDDVQDLLQEVFNVDAKNAFELQLFKNRFKKSKMVLLWDGFDEIVPEYDDFIIDVLKLIKLNTNIPQYISTRTIYSTVLVNNFKTISHTLVPFDKKLQKEFLEKLLTSKNFNVSTISSKIVKITQIFEPIVHSNLTLDRSSRELNTPLMLNITAEISEEDGFKNNSNIFKIYNSFILKKLTSYTKSSAKINPQLFGSKKFNLIEFHQKYALKSIFLFVSFKMKWDRLQVMEMKLPEEVKNHEISQIGILYLTSEHEYEFAHKSFAEFLFAQYIIDNIYDSNDIDNEVEIALRLEMFFTYLLSRNQRAEYITIFLNQYLLDPVKSSQKSFNYKISQLMRMKFKRRFLEIMRQPDEKLVKFMVDFFKKDHDLLLDLLGINQIETFYTSLYKPSIESCETKPAYIKNLMSNYLSHSEYERFINGVNQNGTMLFAMFYCHKIGITKFNAELTTKNEFFNQTSFIKFFDDLSLTLNQNEEIELYKTAVDPSIYFIKLFKNKIFTNFSMSDYESLWERLQNFSSDNTLILKAALSNSLAKFLDTDPKELDTDELLPFLLNKTKELLDSQNIFEMFKDKKLLFKAIREIKHFETLWKFVAENLNKAQQKEILQNIYDDNNEESGCFFQIFYYNIFAYCFNGFKIFHFALLVEKQDVFNYVKNIYEDYFNKTEMQTIALSSVDIYLYMIANESKESCCYFGIYLKSLFEGNYKKLNDFLIGKDPQKSINLIEYFENFRPMRIPQMKAFESLKNITGSSDNLKYDYCDNLLENVTQVIPSKREQILTKKVKFKNPFLP